MLQEHRSHKLRQSLICRTGVNGNRARVKSNGKGAEDSTFVNLCVTSQSTGQMVMVGPNDP